MKPYEIKLVVVVLLLLAPGMVLSSITILGNNMPSIVILGNSTETCTGVPKQVLSTVTEHAPESYLLNNQFFDYSTLGDNCTNTALPIVNLHRDHLAWDPWDCLVYVWDISWMLWAFCLNYGRFVSALLSSQYGDRWRTAETSLLLRRRKTRRPNQRPKWKVKQLMRFRFWDSLDIDGRLRNERVTERNERRKQFDMPEVLLFLDYCTAHLLCRCSSG